MIEATAADLLDEVAALVMLVDVSDADSIANIHSAWESLEKKLDPSSLGSAGERCRELIEALGSDTVAADLEQLIEALAHLQSHLAGDVESEDVESEGEALVVPDWVEESVFREFVNGQQGLLEEIESEILGIEDGSATALPDLRRRIHTFKGEAGVLGLDQLEEVCHVVEDVLTDGTTAARHVDELLAAKDWIVEALEAYRHLRRPTDANEALLPRLRAVQEAADQPVPVSAGETAGTEPTPVPAAGEETAAESETTAAESETTAAASEETAAEIAPEPSVANEAAVVGGWDEETLAVMEEFLQESEEGLATVDEILLEAEQEAADAERINALFRVFHTIKGVSGYLELDAVTHLAHAAETLLGMAREGTLALEGPQLDLIFDSAALMRRNLNDLRQAVEAGTGFAPVAGTQELVQRLQAAARGEKLPDHTPEAPKEARVGDILAETGTVTKEEVAAAAERQADTGRKLGQELIASGVATPKEVGQALRTQKRARTGGNKLKETVKIDLSRVDNLVELIGELVIVESMVVNAPEIDVLANTRVRNYLGQLAKITRDLQDIGMRMRMVPVRSAFQKMARMVRDLSHKDHKKVRAEVSGEWTEMDRSMVEQIADPMVHMVRNSISHGIETPEERVQAGKPETATVYLSAYHQGAGIVIEVADDGRGLDAEAILSKARSKGLLGPDEHLSESEIYNLIFAPGFSTAKQITEIAGRGVGMDVVRRNIDAMRGKITISSTPGQGCSFKMVLPLTLAIIDGMIVACGEEKYIIPTLSIVESVRPTADMVFSMVGSRDVVTIRDDTLPLLRLDRLFDIPDAQRDPTAAQVVVLDTPAGQVGLLVDDVLAQQQVVIKRLDVTVAGGRFLSGAAILSDGLVGLILNVDELHLLASGRSARSHSVVCHDATAAAATHDAAASGQGDAR